MGPYHWYLLDLFPVFRDLLLKVFNSIYWNKHYVLLSTCKGNAGKFYFNICAFNIVFSLTTFKESIDNFFCYLTDKRQSEKHVLYFT
jgi:hypothetical protein